MTYCSYASFDIYRGTILQTPDFNSDRLVDSVRLCLSPNGLFLISEPPTVPNGHPCVLHTKSTTPFKVTCCRTTDDVRVTGYARLPLFLSPSKRQTLAERWRLRTLVGAEGGFWCRQRQLLRDCPPPPPLLVQEEAAGSPDPDFRRMLYRNFSYG